MNGHRVRRRGSRYSVWTVRCVPTLGRPFLEWEFDEAEDAAVLISHRFWQAHFGIFGETSLAEAQRWMAVPCGNRCIPRRVRFFSKRRILAPLRVYRAGAYDEFARTLEVLGHSGRA